MTRRQLGGRLHHPMISWYCYSNIVSTHRGWESTITSCELGPLIVNCHSVILRGLVFQRRIWGSSPHYVGKPLIPDLVVKVCNRTTSRGGWSELTLVVCFHIAVCSSFTKMSVCSIGGAVSPSRESTTAGVHLV